MSHGPHFEHELLPWLVLLLADAINEVELEVHYLVPPVSALCALPFALSWCVPPDVVQPVLDEELSWLQPFVVALLAVITQHEVS